MNMKIVLTNIFYLIYCVPASAPVDELQRDSEQGPVETAPTDRIRDVLMVPYLHSKQKFRKKKVKKGYKILLSKNYRL